MQNSESIARGNNPQPVRIDVELPDDVYQKLEERAASLGMSVEAYWKGLADNDVAEAERERAATEEITIKVSPKFKTLLGACSWVSNEGDVNEYILVSLQAAVECDLQELVGRD